MSKTIRCPQCDFELRGPTDEETFMRKELMNVTGTDYGGYELSGFHAWDELFKLNEVHHVGRYVVRKVDENTDHDFEYSENPVYMVFEVSHNQAFEHPSYYKVQGVKDSYGSADWDGPFRSVEKQEKAVWLWSE